MSVLELTIYDRTGLGRRMKVESRRFTIGRAPENDLALEDTGLSRRHAIIEQFGGTAQIVDCGSRNGTFLNGVRILKPAALKNGDEIGIGEDWLITVHMEPTAAGTGQADSNEWRADRAAGVASDGAAGPISGGRKGASFRYVVVALVTALVAAVGLLLVLKRPNPDGSISRVGTETNDVGVSASPPILPPSPASSDPRETEGTEQAVMRVMRRISSDDKPYILPPGPLSDLLRQIGEYRARPSLATALAAFRDRGGDIVDKSRAAGIEPDLVIYTALADTDGGGDGRDPVAMARQILPQLVALRATFGSGLADASLIVMAAFHTGAGTSRSHPLLATIRRLVKNPSTERNVWYLYQAGGIDAGTYQFVVKALACGCIAQDPRAFGLNMDPLLL